MPTEQYVGEGRDDLQCCNWGGNHFAEFPECPARVEEFEVAQIWAIQQVTYTEAQGIVEWGIGAEEDIAVDAQKPNEIQNVINQLKDTDTLIVKVDVVEFIAQVINCTVRTSKSPRSWT